MNQELIHLAQDVSEMKPLMTEPLFPSCILPLHMYKQAYLTQWSVLKLLQTKRLNGKVGATRTGWPYASHVAFYPIRTELIPALPAVLTEEWTTMIIDLNSLTLSSLQ